MNCAVKMSSLEAVRDSQIRRAELLAEIYECELALDLTLDMPWPKNVWTERRLNEEIQRLRGEIYDLGRQKCA